MKLACSSLSAAALVFALGVTAFAQGDPGAPPVADNSTQGETIPQGPTATSAKIAGTVTTGRARYRPGQPIAVTFTIRNTSKQSAHYDYPTTQQFDVAVTDAHGVAVWDWARGRAFAPHITALSLKPGERKTYAALWDGRDAQGRPVAPGVYTVSARMTSSDRPGVTGSFAVNTDTDPENFGSPTRSPSDNGAVRQVSVNPPITASITVPIGVPTPTQPTK